jgi:ATP-dependent Lon protease
VVALVFRGLMPHSDHIEIPLFPLPSVVLFPNVRLPLHIFEERYKTMIETCIDSKISFGVVLLSGDTEIASSIEKVGVLARVVRVERLDDGRLNIVTEGEGRFRILELKEPEPFWRASIETVDDLDEPGPVLEELQAEVGELYIDAYKQGVELTGERPAELELPDSASELSYMIAYVLDMELGDKQRLLEMISAQDRLGVLIDYLKSANENLRQQLHQKRTADKARGNGNLSRPKGS